MHGDMGGSCEVRIDGPDHRHYHLFCVLERDGAAVGLSGPRLVIITGKDKPFRTALSPRDCADVRRLAASIYRVAPAACSCELHTAA